MSTKTVDDIIAAKAFWSQELQRLRSTLTALPLEETVKWGMPVYVAHGHNIVGLAGFKTYFGLWFFQGALLKDEKQLLVNAQERKTKAMRHWRMESDSDIKPAILKAYVKEAIANAENDKAIKPERSKKLVVPAPLKAALVANKKASAAFNQLTPGKKREYADFIADAKREDTKARRIKKILPMIVAGAGLNDQYKC